jgi:hypothetical protein
LISPETSVSAETCWKNPHPTSIIAPMKPFEEIVQFIADAAGPEKLGAFKPSEAAENRVAELLAKQKLGSISARESEELQLFVQLDHVMSLAKAKARTRSRSSAA